MLFKRNQVEEAIASSLAAADLGSEGDAKSRIKRLLDTDRAFAENETEEKFAFSTQAPPGSGADTWYSDYEVFALRLGLALLRFGWPQRTAVQILRQARRKLEREYKRFRAQSPSELFAPEKLRQRVKPGTVMLGSANPVFLAIMSPGRNAKGRLLSTSHAFEVCRDEYTLQRYQREQLQAGFLSVIVIELTFAAHDLAAWLAQTKPAKRGRQSG